jgi:anti-sigma regulatory factor (Ser/Thr protein kinase)
VPIAGHEVVRAGGARQRDQVIVVRVRRDTGQLWWIRDDYGVGGESVDELGRDCGSDEAAELGRASTSASSSSSAGLAISSKRSSIQAVRI